MYLVGYHLLYGFFVSYSCVTFFFCLTGLDAVVGKQLI